ncbi:ArsR family transcriptional regulator [Halobacteria archaeon AArc-m2/3/4]|uniref:ArsR family transcriptional regulator n=1 Tax=Natronoglomus mannanivorans TaxID=2979990 RepID=A0AAP3E4B5_9EURY|nr:ArsR family transcriptional regulator [Halobacteria archaeon AArc-xg1-1]MCU4974953.1 ArsR family transcriptional regulator [Halobacteria archaeon AArc-m2/3/4]
MKLRQPTDFEILEALEETGRNVAPNLESHTNKNRQNINTRLPVLCDYGLVERIGPAERSGLYEITMDGKAALVHREQYDEVDDFESLLRATDPGSSSPPTAQASCVRGERDDESDRQESRN